jgi:sulfotransferase
MDQKFHFISGLPRSGSTLLSAILRQNPRFHAGMTSPVASLLGAAHGKMNGGEFGSFFDNTKRSHILKNLVSGYYADVPKTVVFDTNRSWTGKTALLAELYPEAKIICCVRDVGWIIDSIEKMLIKNPLELSRVFGFQTGSSVYGRVETLMNSDNGLIGLAWSTLREAWFGAHAHRLIFVPYERLAKAPENTVRKLYELLGETWFAHDFNHVEFDEPDYDLQIGMPGLHKVREQVAYQERQLVIPPDIFAKYVSTGFWNHKELNHRQVVIV